MSGAFFTLSFPLTNLPSTRNLLFLNWFFEFILSCYKRVFAKCSEECHSIIQIKILLDMTGPLVVVMALRDSLTELHTNGR